MGNLLSKRDEDVLEILIADYIASAAPVGSKAISRKHEGGLSPATIRSVMADLERTGLLSQPHTSAGRVPTVQGLRYYVDCLLKCHELSGTERIEINKLYDTDELDIDEVIQRTSKMLSSISHYVGLIKTPSRDTLIFKQIEFISLSSKRLMGIFVSQEGLVQNKIIEVSEDYSFRDIERINNYCNSAFLGLTLEDAKAKIVTELEAAQKDYDRLLAKALFYSNELFASVPDGDLVVNGERQLLGVPEFADSSAMRELLQMLEEKKQLIHLLGRCQNIDGVSIFIGAEAAKPFGTGPQINQVIETLSVVSAPYRKKGLVLGTIGVIGPMRMDYSRVVPIVDFTAKVLEDILN